MLDDLNELRRTTIYIAGGMRGYPLFNFPLFDEAQEFLESSGWDVFSPAQDDRDLGFDEHDYPNLPDWFTIEHAMRRDLVEVAGRDAIILLPGWEHSTGARREALVALWTGSYFYAYLPKPRRGLLHMIIAEDVLPVLDTWLREAGSDA